MPPSFAEEVAASKNHGNKSSTPPPPAPVETPAAPATPPAAAQMSLPAPDANFGPLPKHGDVYVETALPPGNAPVDPVAAAPIVPPIEPPPTTPPATPPVSAVAADPALEVKKAIKIGTREFTDVQAAIDYARELEQSKIADQAFVEGVKAATKVEPTEKQKTTDEKFAEDVFVDPVKAVKELRETIANELRAEYNKATAAQAQAQVVAQTRNNAWEIFFKENSDLSTPETRQLIQEYIYPRSADKLAHFNLKDGMAELANIARKTLQMQKSAAVPAQTLPSAPVVTTGATSATTPVVTAPPAPENVDFVTAVNNMRRRAK